MQIDIRMIFTSEYLSSLNMDLPAPSIDSVLSKKMFMNKF